MSIHWWGFGASVTGASHTRRKAPNEDCFAVLRTDSRCTVAVADGHGSGRAFRSAIGAELAVEAIQAVVAATDIRHLAQRAAETTVTEWTALVKQHVLDNPFTVDELTSVGVQSQTDEGNLLMAYGSTVAAATTNGRVLIAWQIGDGCITIVNDDGQASFGIEPENRILTTETSSLALPDAVSDTRIVEIDLESRPVVAVLLCTDGLSDAFVDEGWEQSVADHVLERVQSTDPDELPELAGTWLEEPATVYGDDTTLAVMTSLLKT